MKNLHTFEEFLNETFFYDKYRDEDILDAIIKKRKIDLDKKDGYAEKLDKLFKHHGVTESPDHYSTDVFRLDTYKKWDIPRELIDDLDKIGITLK